MNYEALVQLSTLVKIKDQVTGLSKPWKLYADQHRVLKNYCTGKHTQVCKIRQCGISTLSMFYALAFAITNPKSVTAIVAQDHQLALKLVQDLKDLAESLNLPFKQENQKKVTLHNNAEIIALTAGSKGKSVGRGRTFNLLIASEVAYYANSFDVMTAMLGSMSTTGQVILESTATAGDNYFAATWHDDESTYQKVFIGFEAHPNYRSDPQSIDEETWAKLQNNYCFTNRESAAWWAAKLTQNGGDDRLTLREYPILPYHAFTSSSGRWIPTTPEIRPYTKDSTNYLIHIYEPNTPSHYYVAAIDTAHGEGGDDSCIVVYNATTRKIAASLCDNNTTPDKLISAYKRLTTLYTIKQCYVEENGPGLATTTLLRMQSLPFYSITTDADNAYKGMLWVRNEITGGLAADERLQKNCESCTIKQRDNNTVKFKGLKDFLMTLAFIGNKEPQWAAEAIAPPPKVYLPNQFNADKFIRDALRENRRR